MTRIQQSMALGSILSGMILPAGVASGGEPGVNPVGAPAAAAHAESGPVAAVRFDVAALPPLGDIGYAGMYAGVSAGALIAAGGTNFPDAPPWKQGRKVWYDQIWVLEPGAEAWREAGRLDRPRALGASLSLEQDGGVLCVGGGDDDETFADAFVLRYDPVRRSVQREAWPALPGPVMAASMTTAAGRVYLVAGHRTISALAGDGPLTEVWSIDPNRPIEGWRAEPPIPAAGRFLPVVTGDDNHLYVLSGMTRTTSDDGKPALHCLADVWRFTAAERSWLALPPLPRANAAAPSPAPMVRGRIVLLGGGVDDSNFGGPMDRRPGFPATILTVDPVTGSTDAAGEVKSSVVAATVVPWQGGYVVVSGEVRAGVRTPAVWVYRPVDQ